MITGRPPDDPSRLIEECEDHESRLNAWEREFLDSVSDQVSDGRDLSDRQLEVLTKIWVKANR